MGYATAISGFSLMTFIPSSHPSQRPTLHRWDFYRWYQLRTSTALKSLIVAPPRRSPVPFRQGSGIQVTVYARHLERHSIRPAVIARLRTLIARSASATSGVIPAAIRSCPPTAGGRKQHPRAVRGMCPRGFRGWVDIHLIPSSSYCTDAQSTFPWPATTARLPRGTCGPQRLRLRSRLSSLDSSWTSADMSSQLQTSSSRVVSSTRAISGASR